MTTVTQPQTMLPEIRGFLPNSLNEWQGRIAAVLWLPGCNWRCAYCHGWRFVTGAAELAPIPAAEVFATLDEQAGWIDGVVISGGEPTLQPALPALLEALRERALAVKLHSNGSRPAVLAQLLDAGRLAAVALDYKAPLPSEALRACAGPPADPAAVAESLRLAAAAGVELELHTTLCPAFLEWEAVRRMAAELAERAPGARWIWQQYNPEDVLDPERAGRRQYDPATIEATAAELRGTHGSIEVRGI